MQGSDQIQGPAVMADAGLITFLRNTAPAGEHVDAKAKKFRALATAAEGQPLDQTVIDDINALASVYEKVAAVGEALWPDGQRGNANDFARGETPRKGSTDVEAKADVGTAVRDGFA